MNLATSCKPIFEADARDFLMRHEGEAAFQKVCDLVRACFPDLNSIHVRLLEDPDEDNHTWVVLHVLMPASYSAHRLQTHKGRYYEELTPQLQTPYHPFSFSLMVEASRD